MLEQSGLEPFNSAFERAAGIKPGKPLLASGRETLTYGTLLDRSARLARLWDDAGLRPGDRVVLASRNDIDAATMFLSLIRCGLTAVVLDPQSPPHTASALIEAADARAIVLDRELRRDWQPPEGLQVLEIARADDKGLFNKLLRKKATGNADAYPAVLDRFEPMPTPRDFSEDMVAYILFTSGTTARPKGVQITRANLVHHLGTLSRQYGYGQDSRLLNVLPLHHTDGMNQGPTVAFWNGATVHRPAPFSIPDIGLLLDALYAERITHFVAVPTILALLLKFGTEYRNCFKTGDFRFVISAAAQLEPDLWERFEEAFGVRVCNLYGLTETVTGGLFSGPDDGTHRRGSIGRPVDCQARLIDREGGDVPDGEPGELLIRGGHVMCGYLNAPEATAEVIREGWLHTGDIAIRDAEGFYRVVGRKKNVIISGGLNVHPEEVTEVLNLHPHVLEACTFGVPDPGWGERVEAAVALDGSAQTASPDLVAWCRDRLPPEKIPHRVHLLPTLPKGPSGKVIVAQARETALSRGQEEPAEGVFSPDMVIDIAARCFNVPPETLTAGAHSGNTPGWDSQAHLMFVLELEKTFRISLGPREILNIASIQAAEEIVREKLAG